MYTHKSKLKNFGKSDVIRMGNWSDTELIRVAKCMGLQMQRVCTGIFLPNMGKEAGGMYLDAQEAFLSLRRVFINCTRC